MITPLTCFGQKPKKITEYHFKKIKKSEGHLLNDQKEGTWVFWAIDGTIERIENYANGKPHGVFQYYDVIPVTDVIPNKVIYKNYLGAQEQGRHGPLQHELNYVNGLKHGLSRTWLNGNLLTQCSYVRDTLDGEYKEFRVGTDTDEKQVLRKLANYKMGIYHGKYMDLTQGEELKTEGIYLNGKKEGFWNEFHDRTIFESNYRNNLLHGKQTAYSMEHKFLGFRTFQDGKFHGPFEEMLFDESRIPQKITGNYVNGEKEGVVKWYYDTILMIEYGVYNGVNHGKMSYYYGNGKLMKQGNYMFGKIDSCWNYYNYLGTHEGTECFDEGMYETLVFKYANGKPAAKSVRLKDDTHLMTEYYPGGKKKNELVRFYSHQYFEYIETHFNEKGKKTGVDTLWSNRPVLQIETTPNLAPAVSTEYIYPGSYDVNPVFKGGLSGMYKFIYKNLQYPAIAKEKGIEGIVFTEFTVETNGSISNPVIIVSPHESLSTETLRILSFIPKFIPAQVKGKTVRSKYQLAVQFKI
ncbi:MAG TPA: energy transducer TonB [Flavobacteriales bacterium]|nr:energy transducer TonB [Flavobacteriales bacterium]